MWLFQLSQAVEIKNDIVHGRSSVGGSDLCDHIYEIHASVIEERLCACCLSSGLGSFVI